MQYMAFAQGRVQTACPAPEKEVWQLCAADNATSNNDGDQCLD